MAFTSDTLRISDFVGKEIFTGTVPVNMYRYNNQRKQWSTIYSKPFKKVPANTFIGVLTRYVFNPKAINKKADIIWLIFTDNSGKEFGFRLLNSDQINTKKLIQQGVITEGERWEENKKKYDASPFTSLINSFTNFVSKNKILIGAGIALVVISKAKQN